MEIIDSFSVRGEFTPFTERANSVRKEKYMQKAVCLIVFLALSLAIVPLAFSQQDYNQQDVLTLRGQITQVDWPASAITVRYLQTKDYVSFDEVTFFVPANIHIVRGSSTINLSQLQIGDQITIEYVNTSPGPLKVISMTVLIP